MDFCNHVRSLNLNWVLNKSLVLLLKNFVSLENSVTSLHEGLYEDTDCVGNWKTLVM